MLDLYSDQANRPCTKEPKDNDKYVRGDVEEMSAYLVRVSVSWPFTGSSTVRSSTPF